MTPSVSRDLCCSPRFSRRFDGSSIDGTRGIDRPGWGTAAEFTTLAAVPIAFVCLGSGRTVGAVATAIVVANGLGLAVIAPALVPYAAAATGSWMRACAVRTGLGSATVVAVSITATLVVVRGTSSQIAATVAAAVLIVGLVSLGPRRVGGLLLYASVATFSMTELRLTAWITVSDLLLALAGAVLLTQLGALRIGSLVERLLLCAVAAMFVGGLLGTLVADNWVLSLANVTRLIVASGGTLIVLALWRPMCVNSARHSRSWQCRP